MQELAWNFRKTGHYYRRFPLNFWKLQIGMFLKISWTSLTFSSFDNILYIKNTKYLNICRYMYICIKDSVIAINWIESKYNGEESYKQSFWFSSSPGSFEFKKVVNAFWLKLNVLKTVILFINKINQTKICKSPFICTRGSG